MKKIAIALIGLCFMSGSVLAGDVEDAIIGAASLDVDTVTVLEDERFAVQLSGTMTDVEILGYDVGDATTMSFSAAWKMSDTWQIGLGYSTDLENFGDSYAVKAHLRYGFKSHTDSFIK